eukprot:9712502-Prorocentrum_lima.AAC.1
MGGDGEGGQEGQLEALDLQHGGPAVLVQEPLCPLRDDWVEPIQRGALQAPAAALELDPDSPW